MSPHQMRIAFSKALNSNIDSLLVSNDHAKAVWYACNSLALPLTRTLPNRGEMRFRTFRIKTVSNFLIRKGFTKSQISGYFAALSSKGVYESYPEIEKYFIATEWN